MAFRIMLYTSITIFVVGLIYKFFTWFNHSISIADKTIKPSKRVFSAIAGILKVIFSAKILVLFKVFIFEVLFQGSILKSNFTRWLTHMLIFIGFMLLLLMHALESIISESLFSEYYSTLNPFLFLREFFGVLVLAGVCIALYRRLISSPPRLRTNAGDTYAIIILAAIMISGILLEGIKITSHTEFMIMVEDYAGLDDEEEITALESVWVNSYGLVSPNVNGIFDEEILEQGREINEESCVDCHSSNKWAFTGFAMAKILKPVALTLDRLGGSTIFWYIHITLCFLGLAYLPFSKMFHIIATPVSILANAVMEEGKSDPANIVTRQIIELDACTHCGACSLSCSAGMLFEALGNEYILPSEKMAFLKLLTSSKKLTPEELKVIREGVYLCTNCDRCTVVCPSGINLKELWFNVRESLILRGYPEPAILSPLSFFRGLKRDLINDDDYAGPLKAALQSVTVDFEITVQSDKPLVLNDSKVDEISSKIKDNTYTYCFDCQNCTALCPVVENYDRPNESLDLLPHQIMRCLGLGLTEMASGSRMLWECLTCYKCQEHCPQKVAVCDLFFQLKNLAAKKKQLIRSGFVSTD
ncbi:MAG: 4Fe-4S dicluster domain-containing protein [Deltaproteobacteria bacterium]|nr:4Fe-4S dicluster domain-containing protein [Deltaproteobacteria bacterium]MBW2219437.1 4Fe-4S dicluster domain-containing protein [Deltaproteobacteria bacterium]